MVPVTALCNEIERVSILRECGKFKININGQIIETLKSSAVCFSSFIKEKCIFNKLISYIEINLNIKCSDSINILKKFIDSGILEFEEDENHYHDIFEFGKVFMNQLLIQMYIKHVKSESSITNENVFRKYEISFIENDFTTQDRCIEYISSHLYCLNESDIIENTVEFGNDFFEKVLTSKSIKIENEDKLCNLLLNICKRDNKFFDLFRHISLEYCTPHIFEEIYNFSVENSFESTLLTIYKDTLKHHHSHIRNRIKLSNNSISSFEKPITKQKFEISNNPINVYEYRFKEISKEIKTEYSESIDISWIRLDLKGHKLKPSSYILSSNCTDSYHHHLLRYWRLEGIKSDGSTVVLDNKDYAFKNNETKEFPLQTNDYFVAFKLIQTEKNQYCIDIPVFDFKGELIKI
ncbi:hypothetical protein TVAG_499660 [Trichomonas vaginalis G3]|uniref:BTB domain-containing protein n=1 Tax=Trichomonas vaginalis (strain ATCC PRA-98 / G3) TaxID=412133 RepID=A2EIQ1_TRIV3|nr:spectrin binding [Trichomonas vaginalis G3]EAY07478.1 hypothetical protein TVAG_499660 [Trichomonas vaginalis G3]KAI5487826.1 spectrin binding [Trichomonas vaginalis G3]|eukprot:XP_001319701.1 hypothetical protein [Trichomonas vaginalis G3]